MKNINMWIVSGICMFPVGYKVLKWTTDNFQVDHLDPVGLNYASGIVLYAIATVLTYFLITGTFL